jgi:hypothetical protein
VGEEKKDKKTLHSIKLTIQGAQRQAGGSIATFDGSNTCITNLQLR